MSSRPYEGANQQRIPTISKAFSMRRTLAWILCLLVTTRSAILSIRSQAVRMLCWPLQSLTGSVAACAHRLVACNLVMEYTLSCAAIARGFSAYLATLAGQRPTFFIVEASFLQMDFFALGLIVVLSCILAYGTKARRSPTFLPPLPSMPCLHLDCEPGLSDEFMSQGDTPEVQFIAAVTVQSLS